MAWLYVLAVLMLIAFVFLLAVKPNKGRETRLAVMYAHRGYHDDGHPENSLAAFRLAKQCGLGVELDVQLTRDKKLVVFHDKNLSRMTGIDKDLCNTDFAELETYRLAGGDERIPLYSEVLETLGDVPVLCEIKTYTGNANCEACPEILDLAAGYRGDIVYEAFSPYILKWLRQNRPDVIRGQLSQDFFRHGGLSGAPAFALGNLLTDFMARPDFIAYNFKDRSLGLAAARLLGAETAAWTIRSPEEIEKAAELGYTSFICEGFSLEKELYAVGHECENVNAYPLQEGAQ